MTEEKTADQSSYEKLKGLILDREIPQRQRITEAFLAEKMNMSRIPVREAIQQLSQEGFIVRTGKNGYQIKDYNEQNIIDLYNYREAMDGMLARLFTERMDTSQLYYLEMNVEAMHERLSDFDRDAFTKIDTEFHKIIARGARNELMEHQHEITLEKVIYVAENIYRINDSKENAILDMKTYESTYEQHRIIFSAIKGKNPDEAEKAARESVQQGLRTALLVLSRRH